MAHRWGTGRGGEKEGERTEGGRGRERERETFLPWAMGLWFLVSPAHRVTEDSS